MNEKKKARLRRAAKTRVNIREKATVRLCVHRTPRHIYAQIISANGATVLATASTVEADLRTEATGTLNAATEVGQLVAARATAAGGSEVASGRSGLKYHGSVKALADAAREHGLEL